MEGGWEKGTEQNRKRWRNWARQMSRARKYTWVSTMDNWNPSTSWLWFSFLIFPLASTFSALKVISSPQYHMENTNLHCLVFVFRTTIFMEWIFMPIFFYAILISHPWCFLVNKQDFSEGDMTHSCVCILYDGRSTHYRIFTMKPCCSSI